MTNKKDLIIAVLATFCLTATLLLITPTRSQTPLGYDPSVDINHDGTINILDAIILGNHFMTSGDPTANVNVTNWPIRDRIQEATLNCSWNQYVPGVGWVGDISTPPIDVSGYSRMYLYVTLISWSTGNYTVSHHLAVAWNIGGAETDWNVDSTTIQVQDPVATGRADMKYFAEVRAPSIQIMLSFNSTSGPGWMSMKANIYLRNE